MTEKTNRLQSLDALRGFDMLFIAGGSGIFAGIAKLTGWNSLGMQMEHADWHGFTAYDMIFPLFLFIAGISFPYSLMKYRQNNSDNKKLYLHIFKRTALLVLFGMIVNGLLRFENVRAASVLGRIGIAWMFAALIFVNTEKLSTRLIWTGFLLAGYWLLLHFCGAPDTASLEITETLRDRVPRHVLEETGNYSLTGSVAGYVDRLLLPGRMYLIVGDPEGILSTVPAIGTALLGMLTGRFVQTKTGVMKGSKIALSMAVAGLALLIVGRSWGFVMPINKNLWTSSFVCYVAGWSLLLFSLFYYIIDVLNYRKWAFFFTVIGLNSITVYMAQSIINFHSATQFVYGGIIKHLFPESWNDLVYNTAYVSVVWLFLYFLYRQKIFLKI